MLRWWDGTMVKTRWCDDEIAMRFHHRTCTITISQSYHRVFTTASSDHRWIYSFFKRSICFLYQSIYWYSYPWVVLIPIGLRRINVHNINNKHTMINKPYFCYSDAWRRKIRDRFSLNLFCMFTFDKVVITINRRNSNFRNFPKFNPLKIFEIDLFYY